MNGQLAEAKTTETDIGGVSMCSGDDAKYCFFIGSSLSDCPPFDLKNLTDRLKQPAIPTLAVQQDSALTYLTDSRCDNELECSTASTYFSFATRIGHENRLA
jgi:hypothetical protein